MSELDSLENENTQSTSFTNHFEESVRLRVPEATPVSAQMQTLDQIASEEPPATKNNWKMEEATEQQSPVGNREKIEMECYRWSSSTQDKNHVY